VYYPDLSPYTYFRDHPSAKLLTVGWLDAEHDFKKGRVPREIVRKILTLCFDPINATRGFHQSPFHPPNPEGYIVELNGKKMRLGSAEIRIEGQNEIVYAAPNLIYHYIKDCNYLPPEPFIEAVNAMPKSNVLARILKRIKGA